MNFKNVLSTILLLLFCCSGSSAQTNKQLKWMKNHPNHPTTRQWMKNHPKHPIVLRIKERRAGDVQAGTAKPQQLPRVAPPIRKQELAAIDQKEKETLAGIDLEEEREKTAKMSKNLAKRKKGGSGLSSSPKLLEKLRRKLADQKEIQQFRISMFHRVTEESEQGRRLVKVQHPIQGDVRYTEHKGKYLNDKELGIVKQKEAIAANIAKQKETAAANIAQIKKNSTSGRIAADYYVQSLMLRSLIQGATFVAEGPVNVSPRAGIPGNQYDPTRYRKVEYDLDFVSDLGLQVHRRGGVITKLQKEGHWEVLEGFPFINDMPPVRPITDADIGKAFGLRPLGTFRDKDGNPIPGRLNFRK